MGLNKRLKLLLLKNMNKAARENSLLDYDKWVEERLKESLKAHNMEIPMK